MKENNVSYQCDEKSSDQMAEKKAKV